MKHNVISASYFEFACPHFSDHRTQEAKPTSHDDTDELCTFFTSAHSVSLVPSVLNFFQGGGILPFAHLAYFAVNWPSFPSQVVLLTPFNPFYPYRHSGSDLCD